MKKVLMGLFALVLCFGSGKLLAQESIHFEEEEDMVFKPQLLEFLGVEKIVVAAGKYEIKFDEKNPNGFVEFNLKEYQGPESGIKSSQKVGIRIAVRKRKCGGNQFYSSCLCGVGFRCGTTTVKYFDDEVGGGEGGEARTTSDDLNPDSEDSRVASTLIEVIPESGKVIFRFTKQMDWIKLQN